MLLTVSLLVTLCSSLPSLPVPGTTGLVPGSEAEAQWYHQHLAHIMTQVSSPGSRVRSLPVPGTIPGLVPGSAAEASWYQAQLAAMAPSRRKRSIPDFICNMLPDFLKNLLQCDSEDEEN